MDSPTREVLAAYIPAPMWTSDMFVIQSQINNMEWLMERTDRPEELETRRRSFVDQLLVRKLDLLANKDIYAA